MFADALCSTARKRLTGPEFRQNFLRRQTIFCMEEAVVKARIDSLFLIISITYFVVGICLGIGMGIAEDFAYAHLHAHINLVGFVAHGIFGFTHRLWPGLRDSALSSPQFFIGAPIVLVGIPLAQYQGQPLLAIVGSLLVLTSVVLFLVMFAAKALREPARA